MSENPREAGNGEILQHVFRKFQDLKSSSEQIFSENWRWVPWFNSGPSGGTTTLCIITRGSLLAEHEVTANYKVVYAKIYWRHFNYSDLFTDRNLVLSSKRLIRKTGILRWRRSLSGGLVSLVKVHFLPILSLQDNCAIFFWRIYRVARNFCGFCFVIMLFKRGVWGAFSRFSPFC